MYKDTLRCEYAQCNVPEFMLLLVTALGCMWKGVFPKELGTGSGNLLFRVTFPECGYISAPNKT